ncbi:MAG: hypothetical protein WB778_08950 [Thermoplasmata archaeon]
MQAQTRVQLQLYPHVRHPFHRTDWEVNDAPAALDSEGRVRSILREQREGRAALSGEQG